MTSSAARTPYLPEQKEVNSLLVDFDNIFESQNIYYVAVLVFAGFVGHQIGLYKKLESLTAENRELIKQNESKDINMKLSR